MKSELLKLLRDPATGEPLEVAELARGTDALGEETLEEGVLYSPRSGAAFPILGGVPVMLAAAFPPEFLTRHRTAIEELRRRHSLAFGSDNAGTFSFSTQWDYYFDQRVGRTWGWTIPERLEQILMEMQVDREWFRGKSVLDAGCGPADLSEGLAALGANVVGLDFSTAVLRAERRRRAGTLQFVRGDLGRAGIASESFDAALSIGVIMCTPDSRRSFTEICRLVKPGGRFYVWVYRRPETFWRRYLKYPLFDLARWVISRLPLRPQRLAVKLWAGLVYALHRVTSGDSGIPYAEYVVSAYDDMTPRWRRYHTAYEVAGWFYRNGFAAPVLSHWDNPYGFGMVAEKIGQTATPGIHFGAAPRLSDDRRTVIG